MAERGHPSTTGSWILHMGPREKCAICPALEQIPDDGINYQRVLDIINGSEHPAEALKIFVAQEREHAAYEATKESNAGAE